MELKIEAEKRLQSQIYPQMDTPSIERPEDELACELIDCLGDCYLMNPRSKEMVWQIPLTDCSMLTIAYFASECAIDILVCDQSARYVDEVHAKGPDLAECLQEQVSCLICNMEAACLDPEIINCVKSILGCE